MAVETVQIGSATLVLGDCLAVMPTLAPVDSIVCDPPYHLLQVSRGGSPRQNNAATPFGRTGKSAGFMGQQWDGGDVAFRAETWRAAYDVLKPGGFLLAFGGTRTWHRLACAIEDAGFVVQDTIAWIYGTGFPKNKALLKPAFEPVIMAYKPGGKRELSIDECRIEIDDAEREIIDNRSGVGFGTGITVGGWLGRPNGVFKSHTAGRWPANVCHDGSDEVVGLFPQGRSAGLYPSDSWGTGNGTTYASKKPQGRLYEDSGSAARFFYSAKAGKADRAGSKHPTVKPQALMRWLVSLVTPPGGTALDPFGGSGSTAQAALAVGRRPILIEREPEWFADACRRIEAAQAEAKPAA